jgi:hypothetical protein
MNHLEDNKQTLENQALQDPNISPEETQEAVTFESDGDGIVEEMLKGMIKSYELGFNKNNDKNEIKFTMTITNHKVATPNGNKAVAYLRLDRSIREKGAPKLIEQENGQPPIIDEGWDTKLVHQEVYFFKGIKEQVDPRTLWKEQLYMNCITRLFGAGLEYAELLHRMKPAKESMNQEAKPKTEEQQTEERLAKIGLTASIEMPKPLTPEEEKYKEWVKKNHELGK